MTPQPLPSDDELIRLRLGDTAARAALRALAAAHPEIAERLADWDRQDRALRALYDPAAEEPLPEPLRRPLVRSAPRPPRTAFPADWRRLAAALALVGFGGGGGFLLARTLPGAAPAGLPAEAFRAFATYSVEVAHPVEVRAEAGAHLTTWLSRRVGEEIRPPDLSADGFQLVGGRVLPAATGNAAMLMYEDASGQRVTLYITRAPSRQKTDLRSASQGNADGYWWVEGDLGCVVAGEIPRAKLHRLASDSYRQLGAV